MGSNFKKFERGFGRYNEVVTINNTTTAFTESGAYGAAAVIRGDAATGTIRAANGGTISIADLQVGIVYELGVESVTVSNSKNVYVLKR